MWDALIEICHREGMFLNDLVTMVDHRKGEMSRTSAIRAFVVTYFLLASADHEKGAMADGIAGTVPRAQVRRPPYPLADVISRAVVADG